MQHDLLVNKLNKLHEALSHLERQVKKTMQFVDEIRRESEKKDYSDVPGILGQFDGVKMIGQDGQQYEVPANYAAKSRLVFGDKLKMIKENDANVFKLVDKVPREKIDGIVTRKDGKWFVLSSAGSYKISDTAAEFNKLNVNDEIQAFIPKGDYNTPYAAFDKLAKDNDLGAPVPAPQTARPMRTEVPAKPITNVTQQENAKPKVTKTVTKPAEVAKPKVASAPKPRKPQTQTQAPNRAAPRVQKPVDRAPVAPKAEETPVDNKTAPITSLEDFDLR